MGRTAMSVVSRGETERQSASDTALSRSSIRPPGARKETQSVVGRGSFSVRVVPQQVGEVPFGDDRDDDGSVRESGT